MLDYSRTHNGHVPKIIFPQDLSPLVMGDGPSTDYSNDRVEIL